MISCNGARVSLGDRLVLDAVDLNVARGEWVTVVGPNGAGKSTLLRFLAGVAAGEGELLLDGHLAHTLSRRDRARLVALVPQLPTVPDGVRVADYVLLGRTPYIATLGIEGPDDLAAVHEALDRLELLPFVDRVVGSLSGGERQRVLVARAIAQGSPIVLFDEPTTALDVGHQQQVLELIDSLRRDQALTVVTTMHDLTLAGQYSDRLVLLDGGRVMTEGLACDVL
ncbi:MAG: cobalamin transport system ATP-binding protein, partial [Actinomycetota bacterium]